jgi:hypothetical protein
LRGDRGLKGLDGQNGIAGVSVAVDNVTTPSDVATAGTPGASAKSAPADHAHKGVLSIRAGTDPQLFSNVTLSEGTNITLTQVGNDIEIASTGGGGGITDLTDDVTASGTGSVAATIANNAVTNAKAAQMAAHTIKSNLTGSTANAADNTLAAVNTALGHDYDGWFKVQMDLMKAQVPQLTNFREIDVGHLGTGGLVASGTPVVVARDPLSEGGGVSTATNEYVAIGHSIFQTTKTGKWAMAWRAKMVTPASNPFGFIGLITPSAVTRLLGVVSYQSMDAVKWRLYLWTNPTESGVATTTSGDANWHNFVMTFDTTTIKLYIDGALEASQATLTLVADGPMHPCIFSSSARDTQVARMMYGYIAP